MYKIMFMFLMALVACGADVKDKENNKPGRERPEQTVADAAPEDAEEMEGSDPASDAGVSEVEEQDAGYWPNWPPARPDAGTEEPDTELPPVVPPGDWVDSTGTTIPVFGKDPVFRMEGTGFEYVVDPMSGILSAAYEPLALSSYQYHEIRGCTGQKYWDFPNTFVRRNLEVFWAADGRPHALAKFAVYPDKAHVNAWWSNETPPVCRGADQILEHGVKVEAVLEAPYPDTVEHPDWVPPLRHK
jgi:hypothetical protein